jgi:hypothetical protein
MPPSPTGVENSNGWILSVMFLREIFFCRASSSVRPSVFHQCLVFFIADIISDGMENYRRLVSQQTDSVGETVGNNFTDGCDALHRKN